MQLTGSYRQILSLSIPIMIGSAAQQVIMLSDSVFLFPKGQDDFAAIGFAGVFYLVIAAIGYGFSKGGQIMIARRMGEGKPGEVGASFHAMMLFEFILATFLFLFMQFACPYIFDLALESDIVLAKSLEYLNFRSYGVFFSYIGLSFISLYTGVGRTAFIMIDTIVLGLLNIVLNYGLIYGEWGLPEMGIGGAGLASTIAEIVAFILFIIYVFWDKEARKYNIFKKPKLDIKLIRTQINISSPIVAQSVIGLGSWFVFFSVIDNLPNPEYELAKANLVRMVYLFLSIPTWGFCSGINTLVSNCIGQGRMDLIMKVTLKTALLTFGMTMIMMIPILVAPEYFLTFIFKFGKESSDLNIIQDSTGILYVLVGILAVFTFGGVYFNALSGTGATAKGLKIQIGCVIFYLVAIFTSINVLQLSQEWAWSVEMFYWGIMLAATYWYLRSKRWVEAMV